MHEKALESKQLYINQVERWIYKVYSGFRFNTGMPYLVTNWHFHFKTLVFRHKNVKIPKDYWSCVQWI
jgi:hypothetical protein